MREYEISNVPYRNIPQQTVFCSKKYRQLYYKRQFLNLFSIFSGSEFLGLNFWKRQIFLKFKKIFVIFC